MAQTMTQQRSDTINANNPSVNPWPKHWLKRTWVEALFIRFRKIYGYDRFWKVYINEEILDEARRDWAEELGADMSGERIKAGLLACERDFSWPPCVAEFKQRCKSPVKAHQQYKALPAVPVGKQVGIAACKSMKDILAHIKPGELIPEHRAMLEKHNPEMLKRIDAKRLKK